MSALSRTTSLFSMELDANEWCEAAKEDCNSRFLRVMHLFDSNRMNEKANEKYIINTGQETTLLIEAARHNFMCIIKDLLAKCHINLNATGKILQYGRFFEGVTALWVAVESGNLKMVQVLIENGATVDYKCTETMLTPLQVACKLRLVDIVKYLIMHGANVEFTNDLNTTCLMIACGQLPFASDDYKGHFDIAKFLLENGADVDKQNKHGFTAMHYAAENNNFNIVCLLLEFNAQQLKNNQSLTPILVAAEKSHYEIVNYLLQELNLTREEIIDVKELLGASILSNFINKQIEPIKDEGFNLLLCSIKMRYDDDPVIPKKVNKIEAYDNQVECQTVEDLMNIKNNRKALIYESLIIRKRILGDDNINSLMNILNCGVFLSNLKDYTSCFKIWNYALKMNQENGLRTYKFFIYIFIKVFREMMGRNININLSDLLSVLKVLIEELKINQNQMLTAICIAEKLEIEETYFMNIHYILKLITLISTVVLPQYSKDPVVNSIIQMIVKVNELDLRNKDGETLIHICIKNCKKGGFFLKSKNKSFPRFSTMQLLIFCGANVNAVDLYKNTPLHCIGKHLRYFRSYSDLNKIVKELLKNGAHTDYVNADRECPHTGYLKTILKLTKKPLRLECLAARVLCNQVSKEWYHGRLPHILQDFVNLH